jgi:hypothetical protein
MDLGPRVGGLRQEEPGSSFAFCSMPMPDPVVEREMCELRDRLDAMETAKRCTIDTGDISEAESENEAGN